MVKSFRIEKKRKSINFTLAAQRQFCYKFPLKSGRKKYTSQYTLYGIYILGKDA